jgi:tetratricopeptide (TPR) repeat protein
VADRYNYLAMLGWLLIIVFLASRLIVAKRTAKNFLLPLFILIIAALALATHQRVKIWHNDLTLINDAVAKTYPDTNLYRARAQAKWQADDYQGALNDFERSLAINPGNLDAHHNRGVLLYSNFQRYQEALAELNLIVKFRPDSSAYYSRGNIKAALNDLSGAIADYSQALSLGHDWLFYFVRANAYGQLKQYSEALADYNQVIGLAPDFTVAYYYKGATLLNLQQNSGACEAWQAGAKTGLKLGPDLIKLCPNK